MLPAISGLKNNGMSYQLSIVNYPLSIINYPLSIKIIWT